MANNLTIIDGGSVQRSLKTTEVATNVHTPHHRIDALPLQHIDSFSRVRTSEPSYRFDAQLTYQVDSDLWDTSTTNGSVTHSATERWAALSCNSGGANTAILQSHYHAPYTPGRSQLAFITFLMGAAPSVSGAKRVGYFDGTNGVYLERTASAVNLVLKSSTSKGTETVAQASWNIDPMDGTGPSGITLDLTDVQILVISLQALFAGRVLVGFDIGGELVPVHQFLCANEEAVPYIAQASLPVRYEVEANASTGANIELKAICATVISEGGEDIEKIQGRTFAAASTLSDADPAVAVLAIQPKAQLNSINQNAVAIPTKLDIAVTGAGCWVEVRRNATITAGTATSADNASTVNVLSATATPTALAATAGTGTLIDKFYVPASAQSRVSDSSELIGKSLLAYSHLLSTADNLTIFVEGGATTQVFCSLKWKEIR